MKKKRDYRWRLNRKLKKMRTRSKESSRQRIRKSNQNRKRNKRLKTE